MRVVSCFNCFAAGVFVSTGLMDVLPDAIEEVEKGLKLSGSNTSFPLAPFFMLVGFFVMLTIEQVRPPFILQRHPECRQVAESEKRRARDFSDLRPRGKVISLLASGLSCASILLEI